MNAPLVLHLHGVACVVQTASAEWLLERRAAALCALAALEPGFPRERAALWLWPDSNDPRRNLRQQLLRFKRQFGRPLLEEGGERLALAPGVQLAAVDTSPAAQLLPDHADDDGTEGATTARA
jgi:DNA-binding SARP family transcriptional activator